MRTVSDREDKSQSDGYAPDPHSNSLDQDVSFVYKPGKEKDFQLISSPSNKARIDVDLLGSLIVMVIFSWLILLGGISLMGIEIEAVYIPGSLMASLVFVFLINTIYQKNKKR